MLTFESALGVNNKVVDKFLRFSESLGSPLFDAYNSSYGWNNWLLCCYPDSMYALKLIARSWCVFVHALNCVALVNKLDSYMGVVHRTALTLIGCSA